MSVRSRASSYASLVNNSNNSSNASDPAWKSRGSSPTHDEVPPLVSFSQFTGIKNEPPPPFWPVVARSKMAPVANPYIQLINYRNNEAERLLGASNKGKYKTFKKRKNRKSRKSRI
jgi:hypothetical protein